MANTPTSCPACGAERALGSERCAACDLQFPRTWAARLADHFVTRDDGWAHPEHPWFCPRCPKQPLVPRQYRGLELRMCRGCLGMLLRHQALDRLRESDEVRARVLSAARPEDDAAPAEVEPAVDCPACRRTMKGVQFAQVSDVAVDVCPRHGLWLDDGELERIATFIQSGGLEWARAEQARVVGASGAVLVAHAATKTAAESDWGEVALIVLEFAVEVIVALLG